MRAAALRSIRQQAGISQRRLAERLGVSQAWVYRREHGEARVDVADFVAWCRACGLDPDMGLSRLLAGDK